MVKLIIIKVIPLHNILPTASSSLDLTVFNFQQIEKSTHIHVALLLYAALRDTKDVYIIPSLDLDVPITKRDPLYNSDFEVFRRVECEQQEVEAVPV